MAFRGNDNQDAEHGAHFSPAVKNTIKLTLAFTKAVGKHQADKNDNLVVSPYNAVAALSMVAKGTDGQTRDELAKTLFGTDGKNLDAAVADYAKLNADMLAANKGQVTLTTANGVWANQNNIKLRQSYVDDIKSSLGADVSAENYADPATVTKINQWASDNTNKLINKIVDSLSPDDAVVLASALHFKGDWTDKFDKKLTEDKSFAQDGGVKAVTPTMHKDFNDEGGFTYQKGKGFEAIAMTYGEKGRKDGVYKRPTMRIVLVRPTDDKTSARDFLAAQDASKVPAWLDNYAFDSAVGSVELPRMDIKQKHDLIPPLKDLGITKAFGGGSFNAMAEKGGEKLYLSKVTHDTVFKTDETGSEAAAVTTGVVTTESVRMPPQQVDIKLDRSFVFALQDIKTGAVIFVGAVNNPGPDTKPAAAPKKKQPAPKRK